MSDSGTESSARRNFPHVAEPKIVPQPRAVGTGQSDNRTPSATTRSAVGDAVPTVTFEG
jgi:hypothetical protein